jgi:hypothetical protein
MKGASKEANGVQLLVKKYRNMFLIPENLNHYSIPSYNLVNR